MVEDVLCDRLRALVQDCFSKHLYGSSVFFADKLVALSGHASADVFLYAQSLYLNKQYRRALLLIKKENCLDADIRFRYLAAKCLAECSDWDECLHLLGDDDTNDVLDDAEEGSVFGTEIAHQAAICYLRGKAYEELDNKLRSIHWYKRAVELDPFCYEAFSALVDNHMLSNRDELQLVESLRLGVDNGWLYHLYKCKCKKYDQQDTIDHDLEALERAVQPHEERPTATGGTTTAAAAAGPGPSSMQQQQQQQAQLQQTPNQTVRALSFATPPPSARPGGGGWDGGMEASPDVGAGGEAQGVLGWGLSESVDVITCRADWYYQKGLYQLCFDSTSALLSRDPYVQSILPVHLAAATQLGKKNALFLLGHKLVEEYPRSALTWFAIGCYYMVTRQFRMAQRYFGKATKLNANFAPAWLGFGHAFASQDESDQAMAAYRTVARMFPGLHTPLLGMGMEYMRMSNLNLAEHHFLQAHRLCPRDPLVCNELGVLAFRHGRYDAAASWLQKALELVPGGNICSAWEPTLCNLAHALRKQQQFDEAVQLYERALGLNPGQPGTYSALGYTHHLMGNFLEAIKYYHKALGLRPDDAFTTEMLTHAMEEENLRFGFQLDTMPI